MQNGSVGDLPNSPRTNGPTTDWVEIVEPQTKQRMYANLTTGQCSWDPPPGATVKRTHENQWWELFDSKSSRFYYYNASSMETIWQKPEGSEVDIIPLAKLQTLKETESSEHARVRRTCETQTSPAVVRGQRVLAQNIGPESGIVMSRTTSRASNGTSTMQQSFDLMSIDDPSESGSLTDRDDYPAKEYGRSRHCPAFPLVGATSTMSTAQSSDSIPPRSSRSSSPPTQKRTLFSTNTGTKSKGTSGGWSKDPPKLPLSAPDNKGLKKDAASIFKIMQGYMGDRKSKTPFDQLALSFCELCFGRPECVDEAVALLMHQLTENERSDSLKKGWELLAILLAFSTPDKQFEPLNEFINRNSEKLFDTPEVAVSHFALQCAKRLNRKLPRVKPTLAGVQETRVHIFNPPQFGASLEELMEMQLERYPKLQLPWIETTLIQLLYSASGRRTEGIFRVAGDPDQLSTTRARLDQWVLPVVNDAHVAAGLLKLWLRQLPDPLIPNSIYARALQASENPQEAVRLVELLSPTHKLVLARLIALLQDLSRDEVVVHTKMDVSNLAMVMAPNVLRCESEDPRVIFENTRREMGFLKTLILHYDTSFILNIN
ncbi:unnamed protein product [Auanema sp. JU1783]|nr:unnamed protein product [Auanema sp. JU1783]